MLAARSLQDAANLVGGLKRPPDLLANQRLVIDWNVLGATYPPCLHQRHWLLMYNAAQSPEKRSMLSCCKICKQQANIGNERQFQPAAVPCQGAAAGQQRMAQQQQLQLHQHEAAEGMKVQGPAASKGRLQPPVVFVEASMCCHVCRFVLCVSNMHSSLGSWRCGACQVSGCAYLGRCCDQVTSDDG